MFLFSTTFRVLYADTDMMQYMYYGNYAKYYEMARTEALRKLDLFYSELEKKGISMPVISMKADYLQPAYYDQLLTVRVTVDELPCTRMHFIYEIFNEEEILINKAETTLIFWDQEKKRPTRAPEKLVERLREFFDFQ